MYVISLPSYPLFPSTFATFLIDGVNEILVESWRAMQILCRVNCIGKPCATHWAFLNSFAFLDHHNPIIIFIYFILFILGYEGITHFTFSYFHLQLPLIRHKSKDCFFSRQTNGSLLKPPFFPYDLLSISPSDGVNNNHKFNLQSYRSR